MKKLIYEMDLVSREINNTFDIFILAGGSDYRAYEILRKIEPQKGLIKDILLFNFSERVQNIEKSDSYYTYQTIGFKNIIQIQCLIKDPNSCLDNMVLLENKLISARNIAIDISCFTKPYFFYLIKLFKERFKNIDSLSVFYTEPQSYLFPHGIFTSYHSSTGPVTILEIPGFSGYEASEEKRILIILLGFDGDLSKEINEDISPSETIVINGFPSYSLKYKDISLVTNEKLTSDKDVIIRFSGADNPFEVFNLLEDIKNKNGEAFINIAPLGTKPMALGACLFALNYPDVRVVYPFPETYEKVTTVNCWNSWVYKIPLNL